MNPRGHDIAGGSSLFEIQLDGADVELPENAFNAHVDGRMVGTIAGDKFFDDGPQRFGR